MLIDAVHSRERFQRISKLLPSEVKPLFELLRSEERVRMLQDFITCTSQTQLSASLRVHGSRLDLFKKMASVVDIKDKTGTPMQKMESIVTDHSFFRIEWVTREMLNTLQCVIQKKNFIKFVKTELPENSTYVRAAENSAHCPTQRRTEPSLGKLMSDVGRLANQTTLEWDIVSEKGKLLRIAFTALEHPMADCIVFSLLTAEGYWEIADSIGAYVDKHLNSRSVRILLSLGVHYSKPLVAYVRRKHGDQIEAAINDLVNKQVDKATSKMNSAPPSE